MIKDLLDVAITQQREFETERIKNEAVRYSEREVIKLLEMDYDEDTLKKLREGDFDTYTIDVPSEVKHASKRVHTHRGHSDDDDDVSSILSSFFTGRVGTGAITVVGGSGSGPKKVNGSKANGGKKVTAKEALGHYVMYYIQQNVDEGEIVRKAKTKTEEEGIVFIDEFDKLAEHQDGSSYSRQSMKEGVQKELLSILEGCQVSTSHGMIATNHILFIASGAFHKSAVSDLFPELQGKTIYTYHMCMDTMITYIDAHICVNV